MKDVSFKTLLISILIPLVIVALGMWRQYSTMDLVYAKQVEVYKIEKTIALQAKDNEILQLLISQLATKVSENHTELKNLVLNGRTP